MKFYMVKDTINSLYEALVDDKYHFDTFSSYQGIYFCVHVESTCYGYEQDGNTKHDEWEGRASTFFHVIILNGRRVFTTTTSDNTITIPKTGWKNTSNHESCWTEGVDELNKIGWAIVDKAFYNVPSNQTHLGSIDDRVNMTLRTSLCGPPFKFVQVTFEDIDTTQLVSLPKRHIINSVKTIPMKLTHC